MDSKKRESSPSTEPSSTSEKRQKSDVPDDPPVSSLLISTPQRRDVNHVKKSLFSAATKAQFDKISSAREALHNAELKIFEDKVEVYISENESLKLQVTNSRESLTTSETALEAAKAELSRVNIEKDEKIKRLEEQLKRDSEKVKAAVAKLSQVNIEKEKKIKELEEKAERDTESLEAAKERLIELRQNAMSESSCHEQLTLKETELKKAEEKILKLEAGKKSLWEEVQELLPKAQRAKELEKKLQSLTEVPPKADQVVKACKSSNVAEKIEQQVAPVKRAALPPVNGESNSKNPKNLLVLSSKLISELDPYLPKSKIDKMSEDQLGNLKKVSPRVPESKDCRPQNEKKESQQKCEVPKAKTGEVAKGNTKLDPKTAENKTSVPVIEKDPSKGVDVSSCPKSGDDKNAQENLLIPVGKFSVAVSDSRFVHMDWSKHYQDSGHSQFTCTKCGITRTSKVMIEDHIWVKHYRGRFECPRCPNSSVTFPSRNDIRDHAGLVHSNLIMKVRK